MSIPVIGRLTRFPIYGAPRGATRAPVDHSVAAVDQPLLPQRDEHFTHRAGIGLVEGETRPRPVARRADLPQLLEDGRTRCTDEVPHPGDEGLPAHVEPGFALF